MPNVDPKKIWSSPQLPSLPSVAVRLLELTRDPETDFKQIAELIQTDPALSAKVLKAVNSSCFSLRTTVTSIDRAIPLLGTTAVTSLALSFSLSSNAQGTGATAKHFSNYWLRSVIEAMTCRELGGRIKAGAGADYLLLGLLLDIGRLAMLKTIPKEYIAVMELAEKSAESLVDLEQKVLGFHHVFIGVELMKHWKLPDVMVNVTRYSHAPVAEILALEPGDQITMIQAAAVASAVGDYFCANNKGHALERMRQLTAALYNFSEADVDTFIETIRTRIAETGELFQVAADDVPEPADLMAFAGEQLAEIALKAHAETAQAQARHDQAVEEKRQLQTQNEKLQKQAMFDPLTGVYNRGYLDEALRTEVSKCARSATPLAVIFIDVDRFKRLNDTYGHAFGDIVLKRTAEVLKEVARTSDILARYGGEEFVIIVHEPTEKGLLRFAERLRERVEAERFLNGDNLVPVTASVGAAMLIPGRNDPGAAKRVVESADAAMYEAKENGRNQVRIRLLTSESDRRLLQLITQRRFSRWLVARGVIDIAAATRGLAEMAIEPRKVGEIAVQLGLLDAAKVQTIQEEQATVNKRFCEIACDHGWLNESQMATMLALQQEEPRGLALSLARQGLVPVDKLNQALAQYRAEYTQWLAATSPAPAQTPAVLTPAMA